MSEHSATLTWNRGDNDFGYKNYSRNHTWEFENGATLEASAATQFLGDPSKVDPEAAFVASLSSCHMLTFLAIASMRGNIVESYVDKATGYLGKNENRKMVITKVELHPNITFAKDKEPSKEDLEKMHHKAHAECFLANSVSCEIETILEA